MRTEDLKTLAPRDGRRAGAILGLAVGDALGAPYEFRTAREVPEGPLEMVGGGWLQLDPGETTDDTALARAVLEGYETGSLDLRRVRDAMLRWEESDPVDIGGQTAIALDHLRSNPERLSLSEHPAAQGNGAVMRAASHGVMARSLEEAVDNAWTEATLTHPSETARATSALVAGVTARLVEGEGPEEAVGAALSAVGDRLMPGTDPREAFSVEIGDVLKAYPDDEDRWGWTVYTARLGVGFLLRAPDFRSGVEEVVRLGGDADTNGAVAGALLGARLGVGGIPPEWLRDLRGKEGLLGIL